MLKPISCVQVGSQILTMKKYISCAIILLTGCSFDAPLDGSQIARCILQNDFNIPKEFPQEREIRKELVTGTDNGGEALISSSSGYNVTIFVIGLSRGEVKVCSVTRGGEKFLVVQREDSIAYSASVKNGKRESSGDYKLGGEISKILNEVESSKDSVVDVEKFLK
jgi:hypothetical protein